MQLYYEVHAGTGPYMLLVHGFLSSRVQWRPNLAALAGVVRPVVVERPIPGLQVVGSNAGHAVNIQAAEVFNVAVVDFLTRHAPPDVLSPTLREYQA